MSIPQTAAASRTRRRQFSARPADRPGFRDYALATSIGASLVTLPLGWFNLASVGELKLKPVHVCFGLLALLVATRPRLVVSRETLRTPAWLATLCYALLIVFLSLTLVTTRPEEASASFLVKLMMNFSFFLLLCLALRELSHAPALLATAAFFGAIAGTLVFVSYACLVFASLGRNLPEEYLRAVLTGHLAKLRFAFYPEIFNVSALGIPRGTGKLVITNLKNSIIGAFLLYATLIAIYSRQVPLATRHRWILWLGRATAGMCLFIVVTGMIRSALVSLLLVMLIGAGIPVLRRMSSLPWQACVAGGSLIAIFVSAVALQFFSTGLGGALTERVGNAVHDPRLVMYVAALQQIPRRWLTGHGAGAPLRGFVSLIDEELQVHNFVLAAWYEGGLGALLAAVAFVTVLAMAWWESIQAALRSDPLREGKIRSEWVAALPSLPCVCMAVQGGGGYPGLIEWTCLALFLTESARRAVR